MYRRVLTILSASLLVGLAACKTEKPAEPAPPAPAAKAAPAPAAPAADDASRASMSGKSDPDCVGPVDTAVPESFAVGSRQLELNGYRLSVKSEADADTDAKIGVLSSINEPTPENLFNLERYLAFFEEKGVEFVVVAGDSGESRAQIETVLDKVAASGLPVLAIAGNRESKADFVDAVNAVRKSRPNLLNGNRVRYVDWDDADLITLPGYHDPRYMHAEAGCQYFKQDVEGLKKLAADANDAVVLVAHGQPRGEAPTALDVIAPDKNHVGDPNLNVAIEAAKIPFGIFANIKEAGGTATADLAGHRVVAPATASDTLFLNPGAADSLEWVMNDGTTTTGTAAVLAISGKKASYELYRAPKLTDAEKAAAAKLVPAEARPTAQTE